MGEDRKDGWMFSFTVVLCYKWVKIGGLDGWMSSFTVVLCYKWVKIERMDGCLV